MRDLLNMCAYFPIKRMDTICGVQICLCLNELLNDNWETCSSSILMAPTEFIEQIH